MVDVLGDLARLAEIVMLPLTGPVVRSIDRRRQDGRWLLEDEHGCKEHTLTSADGTELQVYTAGKGDKVVFFVHGWTCNSTIYGFQREEFAQHYSVALLDLRGHERSEVPADLDYSVDRLTEDLRAAVEYVNPKEFVIAGHSMGGFTAFKFYERFYEEYADRLKGLAIIDSTGTDLVDGIVMGDVIAPLYPTPIGHVLRFVGHHNRLSEAIKLALRDTSFAYGMVRWAAFGKKPYGNQVEHMREMILTTPMTTMALAAKGLLDYHFDYYLPEVDLPVLLMLGDRDKLTSPEVNDRTAELLPDVRLVILEGAGHCALIEQHERCNEVLGDFLADVF